MWPEDEAGLSEPVAAHKTQSRQTHTKKKEEEEEEEGERNQSHQRKAKKTTRQTLDGDSNAARVGRAELAHVRFSASRVALSRALRPAPVPAVLPAHLRVCRALLACAARTAVILVPG